MNTTELTPLTWAPHSIATVDTADGQATGFIGRAAAMRSGDGTEFVLLTKDEASLDRVIKHGLVGNSKGLVLEPYRATLISSLRVAVVAHDEDIPTGNEVVMASASDAEREAVIDMEKDKIVQAAHSDAKIVAVPLDAFIGENASADRPLLNDPQPDAPQSSNDVSDL